MDGKHSECWDFIHTCDSADYELHSQGIGTDIRLTPTFMNNDEDNMWKLGLALQILQKEMLFYIGIHFCIPVGIEEKPGSFSFSAPKTLIVIHMWNMVGIVTRLPYQKEAGCTDTTLINSHLVLAVLIASMYLESSLTCRTFG